MGVSRRRSITVGVVAGVALALTASPAWQLFAQAPEAAKGIKFPQISAGDMKEWLTYLSSDELQGRQVFTEGYGLAAAYVADRLQQWGVKPLGENGSYFQTVKLRGYQVTRNSTVDVIGATDTKTFRHGDHVTFSVSSGGSQSLSFRGAEFIGYGRPSDILGRDLKGKLVVIVPNQTAPAGARGRGGRGLFGVGAALQSGAGAVVTFIPAPAAPTPAEAALAQAEDALTKAQAAVQLAQAQLQGRGGRVGAFGGGGGRRGALPPADITTVQKVDGIVTPSFTGDETFFAALFAGAPVSFSDVLAKAQKGDPIQPITLPTQVTIKIQNTYEVVSEQLSRNVVGMIEGVDPKLKDTYVMFGAHLDHIGYSVSGGGAQPSPTGCRVRSAASTDSIEAAGKKPQNPGSLDSAAIRAGAGSQGGRSGRGAPAVNPVPFDQRDVINNGADDDGSGTTSELAIAKAFASGPKPKRSVVFVWHTGEEAGLYGSRYNADFPVVPLERVQAQLNMDMVGRDDCNDLEGDYANSVFVVGADRISTDLHNIIVETNNAMARPLTLDYELNDPADPEGVYTRSDHYSYAAKGIPIAFFTTGLHPDYHRVSDSVEKILFPKMARVAQLVYETGFSIADTDRVLVRDNKGPRTGFDSKAEIIKK